MFFKAMPLNNCFLPDLKRNQIYLLQNFKEICNFVKKKTRSHVRLTVIFTWNRKVRFGANKNNYSYPLVVCNYIGRVLASANTVFKMKDDDRRLPIKCIKGSDIFPLILVKTSGKNCNH